MSKKIWYILDLDVSHEKSVIEQQSFHNDEMKVQTMNSWKFLWIFHCTRFQEPLPKSPANVTYSSMKIKTSKLSWTIRKKSQIWMHEMWLHLWVAQGRYTRSKSYGYSGIIG